MNAMVELPILAHFNVISLRANFSTICTDILSGKDEDRESIMVHLM
jgi:hypothetical protein